LLYTTARIIYYYFCVRSSSGSIQQWDNGYLYPILPKIDKFGVFVEEVNTNDNYGSQDAFITNLQEITGSLILNVDFNKTNTDKLEDLTSKNNIKYLKDFEIGFDDNLRLENKTIPIPDYLEKDKTEQAF